MRRHNIGAAQKCNCQAKQLTLLGLPFQLDDKHPFLERCAATGDEDFCFLSPPVGKFTISLKYQSLQRTVLQVFFALFEAPTALSRYRYSLAQNC